ncbi:MULTISPECIES: hypothetical protein [Gracilimonas]|uniref:Uncharacterized protein n=1 Tax=Gracilimonas sediminicola TaxID=2952158 RepID=A0A9X2L422_9BACT|nr:hypothetical protein [Gracilimonas sediminicola]MCP9291877.1 hypothetical protein [Gracilimonas sediminicola]
MLIRLITVISLILFMLLMISGVNIEVALYRSMLTFMILFAVVYISIFLLNVLREDQNSDGMSMPNGGSTSNANGEG